MQQQFRISFRRSPRIDPVDRAARLNRFFAIFEKKTAAGKQSGEATATHRISKPIQPRESTPTRGDVQTEEMRDEP